MSIASSPKKRGTASANLICMASVLLWAIGLPAADHLIPLIAPEQLSAMRMTLAAGTVLCLWLLFEGPRALVGVNWLRGIWVGSLIGLGAWFLIQGQALGGAVTAAVISALLPVVAFAIEVVLDGRRLTVALILGLLLAVIGAFLALDWAAGGLTLGLGALLCFGSVISYALGSRLTVTGFPVQTSLGRTAITLTGAAIAATAAALIQGALGRAAPDLSGWGPTEYGALALYSVGAIGIAQVLFIISVERLGIGMSSLHVNAALFYVMLIIFALGGAWDWSQFWAACVVGLGVLVAQELIPLPFRTRP
jgi:drug/metabolite transporter (DMT)-like permease